MLKKISIYSVYRDPISGRALDVAQQHHVWAWVDGNLALHHWVGNRVYPAGTPTPTWEKIRADWTITHLPSGCRVNRYPLPKSVVLRVLKWAQNLEWRGRKILTEDMPACELLQIAPLVYEDMGRAEDGHDWAELDRPLIERLLACKEPVHA